MEGRKEGTFDRFWEPDAEENIWKTIKKKEDGWIFVI